MFHPNVGGSVQSSTMYIAIFGFLLLVVGSGYNVYLYHKAHTPPVERATPPQAQLQQQREPDCTATRPCTPTVKSDGTTEPVQGKPGKALCWDDSIWENMPRLGYRITYRGVERVYNCSRQQVQNGSCENFPMDSSRFIPEAGVQVPRYWFVQEGAKQC